MVRIDPDLDWDNLDWLNDYEEDDYHRPNEHIISLNRHLRDAIKARRAGARGPLSLGTAPQNDYEEFMSDAKHQYKFSFGIDANLHPCPNQVLYWGEPVGVHWHLIQAMYDYVDRHVKVWNGRRETTRIRTVVTQRLAHGIFKDLDAGWGGSNSIWSMSHTETVCEIAWANESPALALRMTQMWAAISNCITMQVWVGGKSGDIDCQDLDPAREEISFLIMTQAKKSKETNVYRYGQAANAIDLSNSGDLPASECQIIEHGAVEIVFPSAWFSLARKEPPLPLCLEAFKRAVIAGMKWERMRRRFENGEEEWKETTSPEEWKAQKASLINAEKEFLQQTTALSPDDKAMRL